MWMSERRNIFDLDLLTARRNKSSTYSILFIKSNAIKLKVVASVASAVV